MMREIVDDFLQAAVIAVNINCRNPSFALTTTFMLNSPSVARPRAMSLIVQQLCRFFLVLRQSD